MKLLIQMIAFFLMILLVSGTASAAMLLESYQNQEDDNVYDAIIYDDENNKDIGLRVDACGTENDHYKCLNTIKQSSKEIGIECSGNCKTYEFYEEEEVFPGILSFSTLSDFDGTYNGEISMLTYYEATANNDEPIEIFDSKIEFKKGDKLEYVDYDEETEFTEYNLIFNNNHELIEIGPGHSLKVIKKGTTIGIYTAESLSEEKLTSTKPIYKNLLTYSSNTLGKYYCKGVELEAYSGNLGYEDNGLECSDEGWECADIDEQCLNKKGTNNEVKFEFDTGAELTLPKEGYENFRSLKFAEQPDGSLVIEDVPYLYNAAEHDIECVEENCEVILMADGSVMVMGSDVEITNDKFMIGKDINCILVGAKGQNGDEVRSNLDNLYTTKDACSSGIIGMTNEGNTFITDSELKTSPSGKTFLGKVNEDFGPECLEGAKTWTTTEDETKEGNLPCSTWVVIAEKCIYGNEETELISSKTFVCEEVDYESIGQECSNPAKDDTIIILPYTLRKNVKKSCPELSTTKVIGSAQGEITIEDEESETDNSAKIHSTENKGNFMGNILTLGILGGLVYLLAKKKKNKDTDEE